jgi:hypothetical protein
MKKLHLTGVLLLLLFSVNPISAQQSQKQPNDKTVHLKRDRLNKRPNSPSRFSIECLYGVGSLEFHFYGGIEEVQARIVSSEDETVWEGYVSVSNPEIEIPDLYGDYILECTDTYGHVYTGILEF